LKDLVSVIPNSVRIVRGHATLDKLALEAFDVGADRIVVIRNWKGNPRFVDVYQVFDPKRYPRICTMVLKGFKLARECGNEVPSKRPSRIVMPLSIAESSEIPLEILECILRGFHVSLVTEVRGNCVEVRITPRSGFYEVSFTMGGKSVGPVLRVWRAKLYPIELA